MKLELKRSCAEAGEESMVLIKRTKLESDHVGLSVRAAALQVLYLIQNPTDVWSLLRIRNHYGAQQHLETL